MGKRDRGSVSVVSGLHSQSWLFIKPLILAKLDLQSQDCCQELKLEK